MAIRRRAGPSTTSPLAPRRVETTLATWMLKAAALHPAVPQQLHHRQGGPCNQPHRCCGRLPRLPSMHYVVSRVGSQARPRRRHRRRPQAPGRRAWLLDLPHLPAGPATWSANRRAPPRHRRRAPRDSPTSPPAPATAPTPAIALAPAAAALSPPTRRTARRSRPRRSVVVVGKAAWRRAPACEAWRRQPPPPRPPPSPSPPSSRARPPSRSQASPRQKRRRRPKCSR